MKYEGLNGTVEVEGEELIITRSGMVARATFGKDVPPRRIPLQAISGVRYKEPSRLTNGWVQLLLGGVEKPELSAKTAAGDPDAIMFTHGKRDAADAFHGWIQHVVQTNRTAGVDSSAVSFDDATGRQTRLAEKVAQIQNKADGIKAAAGEAVTRRAAAKAASGILFEGTSHDAGRNAKVTLYADRVERVKEAKMSSLSRARQDTEVTPVRSVTSVQAKKDGMLFTKVTVFASGNNIDFRFGHDEALRFKDALMKLVLQPTATAAPAAAAGPDLADQLSKLAALRDQGILTEAEFAAKKADILSRM